MCWIPGIAQGGPSPGHMSGEESGQASWTHVVPAAYNA